MTGIRFITDEKGGKTAAILDLKSTGSSGRTSRMSWFPDHGAGRNAFLSET